MESKKDTLPETFNTIDEFVEFWDNHFTTDYPEAFSDVIEVETKRKGKYYLIEIDEDVENLLRNKSREKGISAGKYANNILRKNIN